MNITPFEICMLINNILFKTMDFDAFHEHKDIGVGREGKPKRPKLIFSKNDMTNYFS